MAANLKATITDRIVGDDWALTFEVTAVVAADPLTSARFTVKALGDEALPDTAALYQATVTAVAGAGGQITDNGTATGTATVVITVPRATTALLTALQPYAFDLQTVRATAGVITPIKGILTPQQGVTTTSP